MIFERSKNQFVGAWRQPRIRVQEKQRVPCRRVRAGVHLRPATTLGMKNSFRETQSDLNGVVTAAAIDDDHFVAARAQRRERLERGADAGGLVQRREDDRESLRIHAWSFSSPASTPCGACAFFHAPAAYLFASANVG